jgi:hypothetical protein
VEKIRMKNDMSAGHAIDVEMPSWWDNGSQNTLKPYAMPMQRWMHSAAGGTSHRLNPGPAIVRCLARVLTPLAALPGNTPAASVMIPPPVEYSDVAPHMFLVA